MHKIKFTFIILLTLSFQTSLYAQGGKTYPNGKGGEMYVPNGDISFADEVIEFKSMFGVIINTLCFLLKFKFIFINICTCISYYCFIFAQ